MADQNGVSVALRAIRGVSITAAVLCASTAVGQETPVAMEISAQPLATAVAELTRATGLQVGSDAALLDDRRSTAVSGTLTPTDALSRMLVGTGLDFVPVGDSGVALVAQADTDGAARSSAVELDTLVITGTRTERSLGELSQAVTVIEREEIERETIFANNNLINLIARLVPGVSPPQGDGRSEDLTIRGRPALLLIDGIPQASNDGFSTEFNAIDPSAIERIEVLRGTSAIYGEGASGGIINIITRRPTDEDRVAFETGGTLRLQPSSLDDGGDGLSGRVDASVSGRHGPFNGLLSVSTDIDQGFFDADGDRIPADIALDNREVNLLAKLGFDIDENQSLSVSYNFFNTNFETEFLPDPAVNALPIGTVSTALNVGDIDFDDTPAQTVQNINLGYSNADLFGSSITAQLYYRKTDIAQQLSDISDAPFLPFFPAAPAIFQTTFNSEEFGGRLVVETPITEDVVLTFGADFSFDDQIGRNNVIDEFLFDTEQRAVVTGTVTAIPGFEQRNVAGFVLGEWQARPALRLNAGMRYEHIRLDIDDFTASPFDAFEGTPEDIEGGTISTDDFVFNAGAVYDVTDALSVRAAFSQGFALPPFLGSTVLAFPVSSGINAVNASTFGIEAEKVNNFEGGISYAAERFFVSLSGFYNFSEEGSSFVFNPNTGFLEQVSAPQRNFGIEFEGDWRPIDRLLLGGSITWTDGNFDPEDDGSFVALTTVDAPPWQLRAFVEDETLPGWRNRLSLLYVGSRDRGFNDGTDPIGIDGYTLVDVLSTYSFGNVAISAGIENLLDNDYIPVSSQSESLNTTRFAGPGRVFALGLRVKF
ncbi:MAG: TonB-dependent receptor [Pseudomonadota bacterium]